MGSSKKHKERDRESRKKRRRSRSRSKEHERYKERDHDQHSSSKYKYRDRSVSDHEESDRVEKSSKYSKRSKKSPEFEDEDYERRNSSKYKHKDRSPLDDKDIDQFEKSRLHKSSKYNKKSPDSDDGEISVNDSGTIMDQSIEEANKMRLKLGLKPLNVTSSEGASTSADGIQEVFVKTENMSTKKKTEALREKLAAQKEKRRIQSKMRKVKGLADSDSDDNSSWVNKSRKLEKEKLLAAERAKVLEEMDEEFGVGSLIEEEFTKTKANIYSSKNLSGMTVGHAQNYFKDGSSIILTLKDKDVLAEDEDVLQNVNLLDEEHGLITKDILDKYDEEISGPKKDSFRLGSGGKINLQKQAEMRSIKAKLQKKQSESLTLPEPILASEFYTAAEMVKFKKPKKKVRKIRKQVLKADDLEPLLDSATDHGSRNQNADFQKFKQKWEEGMGTNYSNEDMEIVVQPRLESNNSDFANNETDLTSFTMEEDQAELDLQQALTKARKLKLLSKQTTGIEKMAKAIHTTKAEKEANENAEGNSIVMNETAEFCRALGDIPTYGQSGNREDEEDIMEIEEDANEKLEDDEDDDVVSEEAPRGAWNEVEIEDQPVNIEPQDEGPILEEEPVVGLGIAGALQLATQKGYLDKEVKKATMSAKQANLQATNYTIEDKNYDDDKVSNRRSDRFISGPINDFKDKAAYRPDIKLEYIDDNGRILSQKEAFRYLSHKFHGKGPGKLKTEKRVKKLEEDVLLRQMSSTDTPLKTLSMLQDKQRETQSPYVILSGGSKALQS
ncbi:U4/U6.U5 tri-snRNP-associated protein 1 [Nymphon striatum]|nr:U4/U6.U5 tri-snRNP-associated protein 1 [Nymphon striatum]